MDSLAAHRENRAETTGLFQPHSLSLPLTYSILLPHLVLLVSFLCRLQSISLFSVPFPHVLFKYKPIGSIFVSLLFFLFFSEFCTQPPYLPLPHPFPLSLFSSSTFFALPSLRESRGSSCEVQLCC